MTDEFTKHRHTKVAKRLKKSLREASFGGYEPARHLLNKLAAAADALDDTKKSILAFYACLDEPQVLAEYESRYGVTGKKEVLYAALPNTSRAMIDDMLEDT